MKPFKQGQILTVKEDFSFKVPGARGKPSTLRKGAEVWVYAPGETVSTIVNGNRHYDFSNEMILDRFIPEVIEEKLPESEVGKWKKWLDALERVIAAWDDETLNLTVGQNAMVRSYLQSISTEKAPTPELQSEANAVLKEFERIRSEIKE